MLKPPTSLHYHHLMDGGLALPKCAVSRVAFGELLCLSDSAPSAVKWTCAVVGASALTLN